jgi:phosphoglycolate phosphatase
LAGISAFPVYIFDLDGTLLDSAPDICGALQEILKGTSQADVPYEYLKSYIGRHLTDLFEDLFPGNTPAANDALILAYRQIYLARRHSSTRLYAGVADWLQRLEGTKTTATTKSSSTAAAILQQFGLAHHFTHIQGTDGFPAKPEPEVIHRALNAIGRSTTEALMIGDSVPDILAAKAAGVQVCAVAWGYGQREALLAAQPDFLLDSPQAI